jgi:hypothetical protein
MYLPTSPRHRSLAAYRAGFYDARQDILQALTSLAAIHKLPDCKDEEDQ